MNMSEDVGKVIVPLTPFEFEGYRYHAQIRYVEGSLTFAAYKVYEIYCYDTDFEGSAKIRAHTYRGYDVCSAEVEVPMGPTFHIEHIGPRLIIRVNRPMAILDKVA